MTKSEFIQILHDHMDHDSHDQIEKIIKLLCRDRGDIKDDLDQTVRERELDRAGDV